MRFWVFDGRWEGVARWLLYAEDPRMTVRGAVVDLKDGEGEIILEDPQVVLADALYYASKVFDVSVDELLENEKTDEYVRVMLMEGF